MIVRKVHVLQVRDIPIETEAFGCSLSAHRCFYLFFSDRCFEVEFRFLYTLGVHSLPAPHNPDKCVILFKFDVC